MQRWVVLLRIMALCLMIGSILFVSAGRTDLPMFWAYLAVPMVLSLIVFAGVYQNIPKIMQEQRRSGADEQDRFSGPVFLIMFPAHWLVAGLDVGRYQWSNSVAFGLQIAGLIICASGLVLLAWSLIVNRFYSSRVDIQVERGQAVITAGPYHYVRHPGYVGWILFMTFSGIALGSWLSVLPNLLLVALIVRRTVIEDRMLQGGLTGYSDYARNVRYRLIPGLW